MQAAIDTQRAAIDFMHEPARAGGTGAMSGLAKAEGTSLPATTATSGEMSLAVSSMRFMQRLARREDRIVSGAESTRTLGGHQPASRSLSRRIRPLVPPRP